MSILTRFLITLRRDRKCRIGPDTREPPWAVFPSPQRRIPLQIGVIGAGSCDEETARLAEEVGRLLARRGAVLVSGGMGGVMEAASRKVAIPNVGW